MRWMQLGLVAVIGVAASMLMAQDSDSGKGKTTEDFYLDQLKAPAAKRAVQAYQQSIDRATQAYVKSAETSRKALIAALEAAAKGVQNSDKEEARAINDALVRLKAGSFPVVPGGAGPVGAVPFKDKWYRVVLGNYSWTEAKAEAESLGGRLVCINSEAEQAFLVKLTGRAVRVWVGATDDHKENDWRWLDGTPVDRSLWAGGEPNNGMGGENFAELRFNGKLNDTSRSDRTEGFIMEYPRNPGP